MGSYRIALRHRNHLDVLTGAVVALYGVASTVDFTLPTTATYGVTAPRHWGPCVRYGPATSPSIAVRYTGTGNDRDLVLEGVGSTTPNASVPGYHGADVNMNGTTRNRQSNDRDSILVNVGSPTPNNSISHTYSMRE